MSEPLARSVAYVLFSRLVASPFEEEGPPADLPEVLEQLAAELPTRFDALRAAVENLEDAEWKDVATAYAALFEIGPGGPPLPIREELARPHEAHAKEEVVRFYDAFGYRLSEERAWAPDHLAVLLEFLHLLAFREAHARDSEREALVLAQRDFLERHVLSWCLDLCPFVARAARHPYLRAVFASLGEWLAAERALHQSRLAAEVR